MTKATYRSAGVDLESYRESMSRLPALVARTKKPGVIDLPGGFAGLFRLFETGRYEDPVLVSGTDGVGTKLKVAHEAGQYETVGIDLVAMCVNDCLCLGANPLFFLDYVALDQDDPARLEQLVSGMAAGCEQAGCAILGGETAIMPAVYAPGEFDLAGFCVGVVERSRLVDGTKIVPGDRLIGLPSSGFHSNGYSLIRKVVFERAGLKIGDYVAELGRTVDEILLEPTRIYAKTISQTLAEHAESIHGMAHITGGGFAENVERILPAGCRLPVDRLESQPPEFDWLQKLGEIENAEMDRVFNRGVGFVLVVKPEAEAEIVKTLTTLGEQTIPLGSVAAS